MYPVLTRMLLCSLVLLTTGGPAFCQEHTHENWTWNPVLQTVLTDSGLVDKDIRIIQYGVAPGQVDTTAHRHPGELFVYVQEGAIEYREGTNDPILFNAGEVLHEPPYSLHTLFRNPSQTEQAKLLLIFIATEGKALTMREHHQE